MGFADVSSSDEPSDLDATSSSVAPCDGSWGPTGGGCSTVGCVMVVSPPVACGVFELTGARGKELPLGAVLCVSSGPNSPESMELNAPGSKRICCESSTQPSARMVFCQLWSLLHLPTRFQYVSVHRIDPQHAAIVMGTRNRLHGGGGKSQCRWLKKG